MNSRLALTASVLAAFSFLVACSGASTNGTGSPSATEKDTTTNEPSDTSNPGPAGPGNDPGTDGDGSTDSGTSTPTVPGTPTTPTAGADKAVVIAETVGGTVAVDVLLSQSRKIADITTGTCPVAVFPDYLAPYAWVEVRNDGSQTALVSIWTASVGGGPAMTADLLAVYPGAAPPDGDARRQCLGRVVNGCNSAPCTNGYPGFAAAAGHAIEIAAGEQVVLYVQGEATQTGGAKISVKTEFLE